MKNRERTKHAIRIEAVDFRTLKGAFGRSKRALVGRVMIPTQDTPISSHPDSRITPSQDTAVRITPCQKIPRRADFAEGLAV